VKLILENVGVIKLLIFGNFRGSEDWYFGRLKPTKSAKTHRNLNSEPLNMLKSQISHFWNP